MTQSAQRRCYFCKSYICKVCQIKKFHHIFCSWKCIILFWLRKNLFFGYVKREYIYLFVILVLVQIFIHLFFPSDDTGKKEIRPSNRTDQISLPLTGFTLDTSFSSLPSRLTINGRAQMNTIIGLERNNQFIVSMISKNGDYEFRDVPLSQGENRFTLWGLLPNGVPVLIDSINIKYQSARNTEMSVPVSRVSTYKKVLALTFDGGSEAQGADSITSILYQKGIKATIFITGYFIKKYPDIVLNLLSSGHEIANHSYSHPHLTSWSRNSEHILLDHIDFEFINRQLYRTDSLYYALTGMHLAPYWRAPFGEYNSQILSWAAESGYRHIGWSPDCDTHDWVDDTKSSLYRTSRQLLDHLLQLEEQNRLTGSIILMHLNSTRTSDHAYKILPDLIDSLHVRKYRFVTISELMQQSLSL